MDREIFAIKSVIVDNVVHRRSAIL